MLKGLFNRRAGQGRTQQRDTDTPIRPVWERPPAPHLPPPPPPSPGELLAHLAAGADRIVVVDTETTGVFPTDRVVEVAAVTLDLQGRVVDEWDTLVDPQRDVGPTFIHGVTASMLVGAPTFEQVAGDLAARLHGAVIAAHNLPFDARILGGEYRRLGVPFEVAGGVDTLVATRCKLADACRQYRIPLDGAHAALVDARATARLLVAVANQLHDGGVRPMTFVSAPASSGRTVRRATDSAVRAPAPFLAELSSRLHHAANDVGVAAYLDVLDRAMANLHLDGQERAALADIADDFQLSAAQVEHAHTRWLDDAVEEAAADHVITLGEYDELCRAAAVLGVDQQRVDQATSHLRTGESTVTLEAGMKVCFTGAPVDPDTGLELRRSVLEDHARRLGLDPVKSVTLKNCQLLVAADPTSRSGKANKARQFHHPVVSADDFLAAGPGATLPAVTTTVGQRDTLVCSDCERVWTRPRTRGRKPTFCPDCAPTEASTPATPERREALTCSACQREWVRINQPGRKPACCPSCS
jgi:DNA polymerase III epsilon subunit-like protein